MRLRKSAMQRLGHGHADDLGLDELGEVNTVPNSSFTELGAVGGKQDTLIHEVGLTSYAKSPCNS